eukprot:13826348-Ditylum_brightwellii.AAC.1
MTKYHIHLQPRQPRQPRKVVVTSKKVRLIRQSLRIDESAVRWAVQEVHPPQSPCPKHQEDQELK